jgi:hypothetical protein
MGYMMLLATCFSCKKPFTCNPDLVPAIPASVTGTGEKEPVCKTCVEIANPKRVANGLDPIVILPGAYDATPHP